MGNVSSGQGVNANRNTSSGSRREDNLNFQDFIDVMAQINENSNIFRNQSVPPPVPVSEEEEYDINNIHAKKIPCKKDFINNIKESIINDDDLIEETNKECAICLNDNIIGEKGVRIECGHLYHKACIISWLEVKNTCPTCGYLYPTADLRYNKAIDKINNMNRIYRFRHNDLEQKKMKDLISIAKNLNINFEEKLFSTTLTDPLEKKVQKVKDREVLLSLIKNSNRVIISKAMNIEINKDEFFLLSISKLRYIMTKYGIMVQNVIEKKELQDAILNSGRVTLVDHESNWDIQPVNVEPTPPSSDSLFSSTPAPSSNSNSSIEQSEKFTITSSLIDSLSIEDLHNISLSFGNEDISHIDSKELLEDRLKNNPHINFIHDY